MECLLTSENIRHGKKTSSSILHCKGEFTHDRFVEEIFATKDQLHSSENGYFGGKHIDFCKFYLDEHVSGKPFCNKSVTCEFTVRYYYW